MKILSEVHQLRISKIYEQYRNVVCPLVAFIESVDAKFPITILNEIRSIFSHFSRVYEESMADKEISEELAKAEKHLKRAILDCYKFGSLSLMDFYDSFRAEYRFADLAQIDNGDFLSKITQDFSNGQHQLLQAKMSERMGTSADDLYNEFEVSFRLFLGVYKLVNEKIGIVHRVSKKAKWTRFWGTFGFWISLGLAVVGIILAL